jgi:formate hydrogenlyase subunit 6/NADH:ubiquinone oxidoreductase subunit I
MINLAAQAGVGSMDYELVGDPLDSFHINFLKPLIAQDKEGTARLTTYADASFQEMNKKGEMVINFDKCDFCLRCRDACPFGAITFEKETKAIAIDRDKCVWCLCCAEVCTSFAIHLEGIPEMRDTHSRVDELLSK